jgi:hypothetical protein
LVEEPDTGQQVGGEENEQNLTDRGTPDAVNSGEDEPAQYPEHQREEQTKCYYESTGFEIVHQEELPDLQMLGILVHTESNGAGNHEINHSPPLDKSVKSVVLHENHLEP